MFTFLNMWEDLLLQIGKVICHLLPFNGTVYSNQAMDEHMCIYKRQLGNLVVRDMLTG